MKKHSTSLVIKCNFEKIKVENLRFFLFLLMFFYSIAVSSLDVDIYASRSSTDNFCSKSVRPRGILFTLCNGINVVGCRLIYEIVEPVGEKEICVGAPGYLGCALCVITGEIVPRHFDGLTLSEVTKILVFEGVGVVFAMARDEDLSTLLICDGVNACLIGGGKDSEPGHSLDILAKDGGVTGMGCHKLIVEATEKDGALVIHLVGEYAKDLLVKLMLVDAVVVIEACLCAPADMQGAVDVGLAPLHYFDELVPILNLLKGHMLDGCAGDDEAVVIVVLYVVKDLVEGQKVLLSHVL